MHRSWRASCPSVRRSSRARARHLSTSASSLGSRSPARARNTTTSSARYKGSAGAREVQAAVRRFWLGQGASGVHWLLERIQDEHNVDVLAAVAEIAGDVGRTDPAAMAACLDVLDGNPSEEQEDVALTALRWMAPPSAVALRERLRLSIQRYLRHTETEVQEKAVLAARALPHGVAEALFAAAYDDADDELRDVIDQERVHRVLRA